MRAVLLGAVGRPVDRAVRDAVGTGERATVFRVVDLVVGDKVGVALANAVHNALREAVRDAENACDQPQTPIGAEHAP